MKEEFGKLLEEQCIRCNKKATHYVKVVGFLSRSISYYCEKHYFDKLKEENWN